MALAPSNENRNLDQRRPAQGEVKLSQEYLSPQRQEKEEPPLPPEPPQRKDENYSPQMANLGRAHASLAFGVGAASSYISFAMHAGPVLSGIFGLFLGSRTMSYLIFREYPELADKGPAFQLPKSYASGISSLMSTLVTSSLLGACYWQSAGKYVISAHLALGLLFSGLANRAPRKR